MLPTQSVIYCRVSSDRQAKEGDGARSQEQRCRSYSQMMGYDQVKVFTDDGVSGALIDRPGIQELLKFLRTRPNETVVIIDDISRIARDVMAHFQLKAAIRAAGGRLESPSFQFGETASDELLETIMAATAQYGRKGNREQVFNRMRSRLESGYWTFPPPIGYKFEKHPLHKKIIAPSSAASTILGPALEDFGTGRLQTQRELALHLQKKGFFDDARPVSVLVLEKRVSRMMDFLPLYAGLLEYPHWQIERRDGQHEAVLSKVGLARIEKRLSGKARPIGTVRADAKSKLPLRNFIRCSCCGRPLTGSFAKGKYARYHCYFQTCDLYGHSFSSEELVAPAFRKLLDSLRPTPELLEILDTCLPQYWQKHLAEKGLAVSSLEKDLASIKQEVQTLVRRMGRVSDVVANELEREVEGLKVRELEVRCQLAERGQLPRKIDDAWEAVNTYFNDPLTMWESGSEKEKKTLLRMVFSSPPVYEKKTGFNTSNLSLPYQVSRDFGHTKKGVVDLTGESWHLNSPEWMGVAECFVRWAEWI